MVIRLTSAEVADAIGVYLGTKKRVAPHGTPVVVSFGGTMNDEGSLDTLWADASFSDHTETPSDPAA